MNGLQPGQALVEAKAPGLYASTQVILDGMAFASLDGNLISPLPTGPHEVQLATSEWVWTANAVVGQNDTAILKPTVVAAGTRTSSLADGISVTMSPLSGKPITISSGERVQTVVPAAEYEVLYKSGTVDIPGGKVRVLRGKVGNLVPVDPQVTRYLHLKGDVPKAIKNRGALDFGG